MKINRRRFGLLRAMVLVFGLVCRSPAVDFRDICNQNIIVRTNDTCWRRPSDNDDYVESD